VAWAFAASAVALVIGDAWLIAKCWSTGTVLGGALGAVGVALVALAIVSRLRGGAGDTALVIAAAVLVVGCVLYCLGQALERLLDEKPKDEA
jgi:hypothetical protein